MSSNTAWTLNAPRAGTRASTSAGFTAVFCVGGVGGVGGFGRVAIHVLPSKTAAASPPVTHQEALERTRVGDGDGDGGSVVVAPPGRITVTSDSSLGNSPGNTLSDTPGNSPVNRLARSVAMSCGRSSGRTASPRSIAARNAGEYRPAAMLATGTSSSCIRRPTDAIGARPVIAM